MEGQKLCTACLGIDVKMFHMQVPSISKVYQEVTGITDVGADQYICFECVALLKKWQEFRCKCFKAHAMLLNHEISREMLHRSRKENQLESPLKVTKLITINIAPVVLDANTFLDDIKTETFQRAPELRNVKKEIVVDAQEIDNKPSHNKYSNVHIKFKAPRHDKLKIDNNTKKDKKGNSGRIKSVSNCLENNFDDDDDNEPLSAIITKNSHNITKRMGPKFDTSYFNEFVTVVLLTPEDARREVELRKESTNYNNCLHKCTLCYRGFEKQKAYDNHMKKHSMDFGEYECPYCHLRFLKQANCCKHIFSCHKRKFSCKICPYVCFCPYQAKLHVDLHKGKKYTCAQCGDIFSMPNTLLMHKRVKHRAECVCAYCGDSFVTSRGLAAHRRLLHRQETNSQLGPACVDCDVHFASEIAWRRHLVLSAKHSVRNGCEICGETFPDASSLKTHSLSHSRRQRTRREDGYGCAVCGELLPSRTEYKLHMTSLHTNSAVARRIRAEDELPCCCELCGKRFKKPCFLRYHSRVHSGERPYTCSECGKSFTLPGTLSAHRRACGSRLAPRRAPCDRCDKTFGNKSALNKHFKVCHLQLKPHSCTACGKAFPSRGQLQSHTRHVHHKEPWPLRVRRANKALD